MNNSNPNMAYRRVPLHSQPSGAFLYALAFGNSNCIQIGVGHESPNGLQLCHVATTEIHHREADQAADQIAERGARLKTGRLYQYFDLHEAIYTDQVYPAPEAAEPGDTPKLLNQSKVTQVLLAQAIREVHKESWGHPLDWKPVIVDFNDGRCGWLAFDASIDKVRLGLGFYDAANERRIGDSCYNIGKDYVAEFATKHYDCTNPLMFFGLPSGWPRGLPQGLGHGAKRALVTELVKLADKLWPGEITAPRPLTSEQVARMEAGVGRPA